MGGIEARRQSSSALARGACPAIAGVLVAAGIAGTATAQVYSGQRLLREGEYREKLRGMWLGESIANWTGLQTEGHHRQPPFLTDASWGQVQPYTFGYPLEFKWFSNPWGSDDDTDIEYVYQHLMVSQNTLLLSPRQIADGWTLHINRFIWVSNATARGLIGRGVLPPSTGMGCANVNRLEIDAQLTTELFGAFCPGAPGRALELADLPIRTTAAGHACHAAQFYVVLYALATQVPPELSARDRSVWLVREARRYLPDTSKAAGVVDFVLNDFLANPDIDDWERTRDLIELRYHSGAAANGFVYRDWFESSVNLATGVLALLYGHGDYRRTVQIGTMSGWDSDNGTATMGGLLGLMNGYDWVRAQFNNGPRENFDIYRTRDALPDYTPTTDTWQDTFAQMADRALPMVRRSVRESGGLTDSGGGLWLLPPVLIGPALPDSPTWRLDQRSSNNAVRRAGGAVSATVTAGPNSAAPPANRGVNTPRALANGVETGFDGIEEVDSDRWYYTSQGTGPASEATLQVMYDRPVVIDTIRFIGGDHFADATGNGGWFTSMSFEVQQGGVWTVPEGSASAPPSQAQPFEIIDWRLSQPATVTGVRVRGTPGGLGQFVTCAELDGLAPEATPVRPGFDVSGDGVITIDDLYAWEAAPTDLTGDGLANESDRAYLRSALRWSERANLMASGQ